MSNVSSPSSLKLVILGDKDVGKTCFFMTQANGKYPNDYVPSVIDGCSQLFEYSDKKYNLGYWDTRGSDEFNKLRPLSYPDTDVYIISFSVIDLKSFENVKLKHLKEIKTFHLNIKKSKNLPPIILLATKIDLRNNKNNNNNKSSDNSNNQLSTTTISYGQGLKLSNEINADAYLECSSINNIGVKETFQKVLELNYIFKNNNNKIKEKQICIIL